MAILTRRASKKLVYRYGSEDEAMTNNIRLTEEWAGRNKLLYKKIFQTGVRIAFINPSRRKNLWKAKLRTTLVITLLALVASAHAAEMMKDIMPAPDSVIQSKKLLIWQASRQSARTLLAWVI